LRRPYRPRQVLGVVATVLSTALISLQCTSPEERAGARPIPDKPNLGSRGERLNANAVATVLGKFNTIYSSIAYDMTDVSEDGDNFRILPIISEGGGQDIAPAIGGT